MKNELYPELQFFYDVYDANYQRLPREEADQMFMMKPDVIFYHFANQFVRSFNPKNELPGHGHGCYGDGIFRFVTKGENYWTDGQGNLVAFAQLVYDKQPFFDNLNIFFFLNGRYRPSNCCIDYVGLRFGILKHREDMRKIVQDNVLGNVCEQGIVNLIVNP